MMSTPVISLIIFVLLSILSYFLFRPNKGWFWIIRKQRNKEKRIWKEDILKLLFHTQKNNQSANLNGLAGALKIKESMAIDLIEEMEEEGLIEATTSNITLKDKGKAYALRIIRVHRLWEKYLSERTGFDKLEWHDRAEYMEHRLNADETEDLALDLGNPRFDPHGDPIPTLEGELKPIGGIPLSSLSINQTGRIIHIEDEPEVIYKQIIKKDLHVGSEIKMVSNANQKVEFISEGEKYAFNPLVASNITIKPLEAHETIDEDVMRLSNLKMGEEAMMVGISRECRGAIRRRLLDLGFVKGSKIKIDNESPLGNPIAYVVRGTSIAIRNERAGQILVKKIEND